MSATINNIKPPSTATFTAGQEVEYNPVLSIEGWGQVVNPFNPPRVQFSRTLGNKAYELTDHLGNVAVTLSDRKIAVKPVNGLVQYYFAEVKSSNDYYPGGMEIMERSGQSSKYNFGYQGSLKNKDITGRDDIYSTFFRELDVRTLRWWQVDPEDEKTPSETPYLSMGGNPVRNTDVKGNFLTDFLNKKGELIKHVEDGSNARFQLTGTGWHNEYFKFTNFDTKQSGKSEINLETVLGYSQDYVRETYVSKLIPILDKNGKQVLNDKGEPKNRWQTYCNFGTMFIAKTYKSAVVDGMKSTVPNIDKVQGSPNEILTGLSSVLPPSTKEEAVKAAKGGAFVVGGWPGHVFTLNKEGLVNNVGAPRERNNTIDFKYYYPKNTQLFILHQPKKK